MFWFSCYIMLYMYNIRKSSGTWSGPWQIRPTIVNYVFHHKIGSNLIGSSDVPLKPSSAFSRAGDRHQCCSHCQPDAVVGKQPCQHVWWHQAARPRTRGGLCQLPSGRSGVCQQAALRSDASHCPLQQFPSKLTVVSFLLFVDCVSPVLRLGVLKLCKTGSRQAQDFEGTCGT